MTTEKTIRRRRRLITGLVLAVLIAAGEVWMEWASNNPRINSGSAFLPEASAQEGSYRLDLYYDLNCRLIMASATDVRDVFQITAVAYRGTRGNGQISKYGSKQDRSCIKLNALRAGVEDAVGVFAKLTHEEDDIWTVGEFSGASNLVKDVAADMIRYPACAGIALRAAEIHAEMHVPFPLSLINGSKSKLEEELADVQRQYRVCTDKEAG